MSWGPLRAARIDFNADSAPLAPEFGDVYHARAGGLAQAQHVFLGGNQLPGRWAGRPRFVVLETGFGLGLNFLATWQAWRDDPARCDQLWYLAIDKHPPQRADLACAHAGSAVPALAAELVRHWPPLTPDLHPITLDGGRVRLLLALGDIAQVLPELVAPVDAFYLDGFAPARNPEMWDTHQLRGLKRLAAPGATVATWSVAGAVREGLRSAGFAVEKAPGFAHKREMTVGRFAPQHTAAAPPGRRPLAGFAPSKTRVAVLGAGLAGAAVARALAALGAQVQVFDRQPGCAMETSGNAGGLFHGIVHGHDGTHARWLRAAALHTQRVLQPLLVPAGGDAPAIPGALGGLLRGEHSLGADAMQALIERLALPADYVQVRPGALQAGGPAWWYPGGGWVAPAALCAAWLATPGIHTRYATPVAALQPTPAGWRLRGPQGETLADVDAVVLCNAADATRLLGQTWATPLGQTWATPLWPLQRQRGQTTVLPASTPGLPALPWPLADGGYALQLSDGGLLCGGGSADAGEVEAEGAGLGDGDPTRLRASEQASHLAILRRLTGWAGPVDAATLGGRAGWRLQSDDRLPLLGPVPWLGDLKSGGAASDEPAQPAQSTRPDQPRFAPRHPGLYVFTALGSRGITQAALGGELLAAWLSGAPVPAPSSLLDALDPARFQARQVRLAGAGQAG